MHKFLIVWNDGSEKVLMGHSVQDALDSASFDPVTEMPRIRHFSIVRDDDEQPKDSVCVRGKSLFADASKKINGERQDTYGAPEDSFERIAVRWNQYLQARNGLKTPIVAKDVTIMMADFKLARECTQRKRDNIVDLVGYLGLHDDL